MKYQNNSQSTSKIKSILEKSIEGGRALNAIWFISNIAPLERLILLKLGSELDFRTNFRGERYFFQETLATKLCVSLNTFKRAVSNLIKQGWLIKRKATPLDGLRKNNPPLFYKLSEKIFTEYTDELSKEGSSNMATDQNGRPNLPYRDIPVNNKGKIEDDQESQQHEVSNSENNGRPKSHYRGRPNLPYIDPILELPHLNPPPYAKSEIQGGDASAIDIKNQKTEDSKTSNHFTLWKILQLYPNFKNFTLKGDSATLIDDILDETDLNSKSISRGLISLRDYEYAKELLNPLKTFKEMKQFLIHWFKDREQIIRERQDLITKQAEAKLEAEERSKKLEENLNAHHNDTDFFMKRLRQRAQGMKLIKGSNFNEEQWIQDQLKKSVS